MRITGRDSKVGGRHATILLRWSSLNIVNAFNRVDKVISAKTAQRLAEEELKCCATRSQLKKATKTQSPVGTLPSGSHDPRGDKVYESLFALIIGINTYQNVTPLEGAVSDARGIEQYLNDMPGVLSENVKTLLDQDATRSNIIQGIQDLSRNPKIAVNDPILIFFAGHGGEAPAPSGWHAQRSKIQMIVPQDYGEENQGKRVLGIPDRTISALLEELAQDKGNNIVVVLDCCHSGSGTRKNGRVRSVSLNDIIPADIDAYLWKNREGESATIPVDLDHQSDTSHVLLAACAPTETAMEFNDGGAFTKAFLNTITSLKTRNLTYGSLIKQLPELPGQTPRCEGKNKDRLFFSTEAIQDESFYEVKKKNREWVLEAGHVHGVTKGSEFSLYEERNVRSSLLGKATVQVVGPLSSFIELCPGFPEHLSLAYAPQALFGTTQTLRVYLSDDPKLDFLRRKLQHEIESNPHLYALTNPEEARLSISVYDDTATFSFTNSPITTLDLIQIPFRVNLKEEDVIMRVMEAASSFNRYLHHHPTDVDGAKEASQGLVVTMMTMMNSVFLEPLYRFVETYVGAKQPSKEPISIHFTKLRHVWGCGWLPVNKDENLNNNNQVDVISGDTVYGLEITNSTNDDLYPYLFIFNCNDLSITSCYSPPIVKKNPDPPLRAGRSITVGYGDGVTKPWMHLVQPQKREGNIVRDAEDRQVEFFKLILTKKPVELSFIEQKSPFDGDPRVVFVDTESFEPWITVLLTVVAEKEPVSS